MPDEQDRPATDSQGEAIEVHKASPVIPTVEAAGDTPETGDQQVTQTDSQAPAADESFQAEQPPITTVQGEEPQTNQSPQKPKKPIGTIVIATIVALALCGAVVYAYLQQDDGTQPAQTNDTTSQAEDATQDPAKELDTTDQEVDDALKAADDTDFPESELSDENLGL